MAEYQLTATEEPCAVIYTDPTDGTVWTVPPDPANRHYAEYLKWKEDGGVPDPYVPPEPEPPEAQPETTVLYDHENRLRSLEGQPPLTLTDFLTKMSGK